MDQNSPIQEKLIRFQKQTKLSVWQISYLCGVTPGTIYNWLRGRGSNTAKLNQVEGAMRVYLASRREERALKKKT